MLATDKLFGFDTLEKTQCLPLYRYTAEGERVSNVTDWAVREFNEHCRETLGGYFHEFFDDGGITAEDIFAYVYAVLHDPVYRHDYEGDLRREFPRLPFYKGFPGLGANGAGAAGLAPGVRVGGAVPAGAGGNQHGCTGWTG